MTSPWSAKKDCRAFFKSLWSEQESSSLIQRQKLLDVQLRSFMRDRKGLWGAYRALPEEANVDGVLNHPDITWVFPRMQGSHLEFFLTKEFVPGPFGVLEPAAEAKRVEIDKLQGVLIPGLGFNEKGSRLGKGKGFYDRTLEHFRGEKVGVCFDFQVVQTPLPVEKHDVTMDHLVTESGWKDCQ